MTFASHMSIVIRDVLLAFSMGFMFMRLIDGTLTYGQWWVYAFCFGIGVTVLIMDLESLNNHLLEEHE